MEALKPLMDAMTGFGVAGPLVGFLCWLYWQERTERREQASKLLQIMSDSIEAEKDMTAALNLLTTRIAK